jgi:hypothetical protein
MLFRLYDSANDIVYTPEGALQEGLGMVKTLKVGIDKLELGSKLRKDVWLREISWTVSNLPSQHLHLSCLFIPFSIDNIVPTSGMRGEPQLFCCLRS